MSHHSHHKPSSSSPSSRPSRSTPRRKAYFKPPPQEPISSPSSHKDEESTSTPSRGPKKPFERPKSINPKSTSSSSKSTSTNTSSASSFKPKMHPPKSPTPHQKPRPLSTRPLPRRTERPERPERPEHPGRPSSPTPAPNALSPREVKVYGLHACLALFKKRPQDLIRLYCLESTIPRIQPLLKYCVDNKKAYHVVSAEELQRITDSMHHEGICLLTRERAPLGFEELLSDLKKSGPQAPQTLIYLEGVENPHNIGSLLRTCAHFGVRYLLADIKELSALPSATYRVAKGGVEEVAFVPLSQPLKMLRQLKESGFTLIASSGHAKKNLYQKALPEKTCFLFGSETRGIADSFLKLCADVLAVPGSGGVESLNVSVTSALFLGEFWRQHKTSHSTP